MIRITTDFEGVEAIYESQLNDGSYERVRATGATLIEAVTNLVVRFAQLQEDALEELRYRGMVRAAGNETKGVSS